MQEDGCPPLLLTVPHSLIAHLCPQLGLVNELVDSPAELEGAARRMAADMLATSRLGLQASGTAARRLPADTGVG